MKRETILWIGLAVLVTVLLFMTFGRSGKTYEQGRKDAELEMLKQQVPAIIQDRDNMRAKYDSLLASSQSIIDELEARKQPIKYVIQNIPRTVDAYDKEQLRSAIISGN